MARRRYGFDEKKIQRFVKEGRGSGQGEAYKPWLTVKDVPSCGRSHRPRGLKTGRVHHLLSDIEKNAFLIFDWADSVRDIREQFPLDRETTLRIAEQMGVKHPCDIKSRVPLVMTTDLLVDLQREGRFVMLARAVKPADKFNDKRTIEKLEIERRYWIAQNVNWGIITERDIPRTLVRNIEYVHTYAMVDDLAQPYPGYFAEKAARIVKEVHRRTNLTLRQFCEAMDGRWGMEAGACLLLVRHLLATKALICDMTDPIDDSIAMGRFWATEERNAKVSA